MTFRGKFGQKSNMSKTEYINDPEKYFKVVFDEKNVISQVRIIVLVRSLFISFHKIGLAKIN